MLLQAGVEDLETLWEEVVITEVVPVVVVAILAEVNVYIWLKYIVFLSFLFFYCKPCSDLKVDTVEDVGMVMILTTVSCDRSEKAVVLIGVIDCLAYQSALLL